MIFRKNNYIELVLIVLFAIIPLFVSLPYRVNIFLSWEGAYRMSQGQLPFKDFGTPLGGMYWVVPAIFMKIFGPQMISLVKAQVFLNIISGLSFCSILKSCRFDNITRFLSLLVFVLSFSFFNFWPWYNHTVIVYQLIAIAFLLKYILPEENKVPSFIWLFVGAFMSMSSFFTKQDSGALTILICLFLLFYYSWSVRKINALIIYLTSLFGFISIYFLLFKSYSIGYWFNYGQVPHSARVSFYDIVKDFFEESQWIKFYLLMIISLVLPYFTSFKNFIKDKFKVIPILLTLGILAEALIIQVTSYTPPDNNIFFHAFAISFLLWRIKELAIPSKMNMAYLIWGLIMVILWWSPNYWKYMQRIFLKTNDHEHGNLSNTGENLVNRDTYMITPKDTTLIDMSEWKLSKFKTLQGIRLPEPTIVGIDKLLAHPYVKDKPDIKVLNMTELTSLAVEMPFKLEKGSHYPLWFHLGVGMFNKQAEMFEERIALSYYDLVLFENVPTLNNFYPFRIRNKLKEHYKLVDQFLAPRRGDTKGMIEVYMRK